MQQIFKIYTNTKF